MYKEKYILNTINNKVTFPNFFDKIDVVLNDVRFVFNRESEKLIITLESKIIDENKIKKLFLELYRYINLVVGYYPKLINSTCLNANELAEKYKTSKKYIEQDVHIIKNMTIDNFKESFSKFLNLSRISFQLDYYNIATAKISDFYPQIALVNILQCFDGIYDSLKITENKREFLTSNQKEKLVSLVNSIEYKEVVEDENDEEKRKKLELKLKNTMNNNLNRIEIVSYRAKLKTLFNDIESKYNVFCFNKTSDFNDFISRCIQIRNKFSHASIEEENLFNGFESVYYLYKLTLVFRLLIIDEIGLDELIDRELLKKLIINIDVFKCCILINKYLNKVGEVSE